eukprot:9206762-Pyramimonas_sp.AAC.1
MYAYHPPMRRPNSSDIREAIVMNERTHIYPRRRGCRPRLHVVLVAGRSPDLAHVDDLDYHVEQRDEAVG